MFIQRSPENLFQKYENFYKEVENKIKDQKTRLQTDQQFQGEKKG